MPPENEEPETRYDSDAPDEQSLGSQHANQLFNRGPGRSPTDTTIPGTSANQRALAGAEKAGGFYNPNGDGGKAKALAGDGIAAAEGAAASGVSLPGGSAGSGTRQLFRGKVAKRGGIAGAFIGLLLGGGLFFGGSLIGVGQVIQYSHILQAPAGNEATATSTETGSLIRWARNKDFGETRLGNVASIINKTVLKRLANNGITFGDRDSLGYVGSVNVDTTKEASQWNGLSEENARNAIASTAGVSPDDVIKTGTGTFSIRTDINGALHSTDALRSITTSLVSEQYGNGKVFTALKLREPFAYAGASSWLHPIKRISGNIDAAVRGTATYTKLQDWFKQRTSSLTQKTPQAEIVDAEVSTKLSSAKTAAGVVAGGATVLCVVKDIAAKVPELNRANVVEPAMHLAGDAMGVGDQSGTGQDNSMAQVGAIVNNFRDANGNTVWQSKPLIALEGGQGGQDIDSTIKPAFAPTNTAANVTQTIDAAGGAGLCSFFGQLATAAVGIVLLASGPTGFVAKLAEGAITAGIGYEAVTALEQYIPKLLADKPLTGVPHQGPNGGSVDALGARELFYTAYRSSAAVEMSPTETVSLDNQQRAIKQATINSESIADRIFNPSNENSLAGHLADDLTPNFRTNLAIIGSSIPHMGSGLLSSIASLVSPKAHAADPPYQWPDPEYAISQSDQNSPAFQNPYANADAVAATLDSNGGVGSDFLAALNKRTEACFGDNINKDSDNLWTVTTDNDTNPASADYQGADCKSKDPWWTQIRSFIFGTRTGLALGCYEGDTPSCTSLSPALTAASSATATVSSIGQTQWPFKPDVQVTVIQCFHDPLTGGTHPGIDLDAPEGTPIYAITAGTVHIHNQGETTNYGPNYVTIDPDSSTGFGSGYGHMDTATVTDGQHVDIGDQVGTEGSKGDSTGPHLHLNIFPGPYGVDDSPNIDPWPSLKPPPGTINAHNCT